MLNAKDSPKIWNNIADLSKLKRVEILKKYFIERYQSPYTKRKYTIQNNDSIEKILNNYDVKYSEIKSIVNDLKKKKLSNIYSGRELEIVIKKK